MSSEKTLVVYQTRDVQLEQLLWMMLTNTSFEQSVAVHMDTSVSSRRDLGAVSTCGPDRDTDRSLRLSDKDR